MISSFIKKTMISFLVTIVYLSSFAQNEPVSQAANSMVDLLTGDFQYSLPVMTVPGPNGENVPINFSYHGGIRMDQEASWIGLGWDYEPGEISRNLKGIADDWKDKTVITTTTSTVQTVDNTKYYGPMHFSTLDYNVLSAVMDVTTSNYKLQLQNGYFYSPAYDRFNVSGPNISGSLELRMFDYSYFHTKTKTYEYYDNSVDKQHFSKVPNFVFTDDLNSSISVVNDEPAGAYNPTTNRARTAYYVEKWTNSELNNNPPGFLDYRLVTGVRRPSAEFDPDGIGAIRITTPEGMMYHYSLPVYMLEGENTSTFDINSTFDIDNNGELTEYIKESKYAVSWKLTAITGTDYNDKNSNGVVDIGDSGYWISYNYGKWCNNFKWQYPFFNYNASKYDKREPSGYRHPKIQPLKYMIKGTVSSGQVQKYYLNSIQTATHTAYFIKEIRLDGHSVKDVNITPALRLNKIILIKNENNSLYINSGQLPVPVPSRFSVANCSTSDIQPHVGNYNYISASLNKNVILAMVELHADYSLCKKNYNNINNTFNLISAASYSRLTSSGSTNFTYTKELYKKFDHNGQGPVLLDQANSGKLTLKELKIYSLNLTQTAPSYLFEYDDTNTLKNPDYGTFKTDYWGYFKSDFNNDLRWRYTTEGIDGSCNNVDVWSLKKITTPLGGEIHITYESDSYDKVNYGMGYRSPKRSFLVSSGTKTGPGFRVTVNAEINSFMDLPTVSLRRFFIPSSNGSLCSGKDYNGDGGSFSMSLTKVSSTAKDQIKE